MWDHKQGDMHMVAAKLGCERAMVGTTGMPLLTLAAWTGLQSTTGRL